MKTTRYSCSKCIFLFLLLCQLLGTPSLINASQEKQEHQRVLVVNSYHPGYSWSDDIMLGIQDVFGTQVNVELIIEYLDTKRHFQKPYFQQMKNLFRHKYLSTNIDIIITSDDNALDFVLSIRKELFPDIPLIFCGIDHIDPKRIVNQEPVYGIEEADSTLSTIDLILSIHPDIKSIAFVADETSTGKLMIDKAKRIESTHQNKIHFKYLIGMSAEELQSTLKNIPENTVIFYLSFIRDKNGKVFSIKDSMQLIAGSANVPVYCSWGFQPETGVLGGNILSGYKQGEISAKVARRLLDSNSLESIPDVQQAPLIYKFDYQAMNRFNIDNSRIPQNSIIYNKPYSFYNDHKKVIWSTLFIILSLLLFIMLLFLNIGRRKKAETELQKAHNELEWKVEKRTKELSESNKMLTKEMEGRKRKEKALAESEEKHRALIENLSDLIIILDKDGINVWNSPAVRQYGIEPEDAIGRSCDEYIHPDDLKEFRKLWDEIIANPGKIFIDEHRVTGTPEKPETWIYQYNTMVYLPNVPGINGVVAVCRNVTERKRGEAELREREARYTLLFNSTNDAVFVHGIDNGNPGKFTEVNDIACQRLGYSREELLRMSPIDIDAGKKSEARAAALELLAETGQCVFEMVHTGKSGDKIPVEISSRIFEREGENYVLSVARDITERKMAENVLKESEQRYIKAQRLGKVGNWEYDLVTENFWGSDEAKRIYGFDPKSENFTTDDVENCIPERESVHQALIDLIENNKPYNLEFEIHPITGPQSKIIKSIAEVIKDDSGAPIKVTGVIQDITKQKTIEKEKEVLQTQLQQTQKMETIGTLAGGIAHDFNNILFPIVGYTEMLLEDIPKDSPLRENLDEIYSGSLRARDLVKQILTFSRQDSNELKFLRIQPIIKEALKLIRSTIPTTINIKQDIKDDCGIIKADPTQIHQIVMNLSTNAYHAMEDDGGEMRINLKEVTLGRQDVIGLDIATGVYACLTVTDTGTGMDKYVLEKAFDPFFTTKELGKGTGMGLSVIHGIVKNAGGSISVKSEIGKGTEFHIYLPVVKSSSGQHELQTKEPIIGGTERILLVDDENAILNMEKQMLERLGYQVVSRVSSIEAIETFRSAPDKFDVVITDMAMPSMSGDKLSAELIKIRHDIPILLCTGFSENMPEETAKSIGIKGFLMKPIVKADLAKKIREVLDG